MGFSLPKGILKVFWSRETCHTSDASAPKRPDQIKIPLSYFLIGSCLRYVTILVPWTRVNTRDGVKYKDKQRKYQHRNGQVGNTTAQRSMLSIHALAKISKREIELHIFVCVCLLIGGHNSYSSDPHLQDR